MPKNLETSISTNSLLRNRRLSAAWITKDEIDLSQKKDTILSCFQESCANILHALGNPDLRSLDFDQINPSIETDILKIATLKFASNDDLNTASPGFTSNDRIKAKDNTLYLDSYHSGRTVPDILIIDGEDIRLSNNISYFFESKFVIVYGPKDDLNKKSLIEYLTFQTQYYRETANLGQDCVIFTRREINPNLPVHFFTIVLNGEPFIRYHEHMLNKLPFEWHWHIVEGVAELTHDTAWSLQTGGKIPHDFHSFGRSIDGTTEYLDNLVTRFPENITIYRKPLTNFWDGKIEMVRAPLVNLKDHCLLWQLDSDELWSPQQVIAMRAAFLSDPTRTAAWFWCNYYVGPKLGISTRNNYAQNPNQEWLRVWNYRAGMYWCAHEPPILSYNTAANQTFQDVGRENPFNHAETEAIGAVFNHFSYVTEAQLKFKESYYGLTDALGQWRQLQHSQALIGNGSGLLRNFLPWVTDQTMYRSVSEMGWKSPASYDDDTGIWAWNLMN